MGCINDVGATSRLLDDQISHSKLESVIYQSCHDDMKTLLQAVSSKFSNAVIIVTGYFIAISWQTIQNGGENMIKVMMNPPDPNPNFGVIVSVRRQSSLMLMRSKIKSIKDLIITAAILTLMLS